MRLYVFTLTEALLFLFLCPLAHGQTSSKSPGGDPQKAAEDKDPLAIVELGAATSWNLSGGAATFAPNLAAEVTPIENHGWLYLTAVVPLDVAEVPSAAQRLEHGDLVLNQSGIG